MEYAFYIVLIAAALLVVFSRKNVAMSAFMLGCIYSPSGVGFEFLGLNFLFFRFLVALAILRILLRGEHRSITFSRIDFIVILLSVALILSSLFHAFEPGSGPVYISGVLLNSSGAYFVFRVFTVEVDTPYRIAQTLMVLLVPIAASMLLEQILQINYFSFVSSLPTEVMVRDGRIRSTGPFAHPILAGTIGAALLPLALLLSRERAKALTVGIACITIAVTSASSGPLMTMTSAIICMCLWRHRALFRYIHISALVVYALLFVVMNRPPYYIISELGIIGGSTGWYRSYLIESTITHFSEWWLFGTDRTIHWIPGQNGISESHADITNFFIGYAVMGGLSAILLFVWLNWEVYRNASLRLTHHHRVDQKEIFFLLASFFAYLVTFFSVSLFGQDQVFYWMIVAMIASACSRKYDDPVREVQHKAERCDSQSILTLNSFRMPGTLNSCQALDTVAPLSII